MEERGWNIFNGNIKGDEEGEFTFTGGKGCTVIDYVMGSIDVRDNVKELRVGDRIESDHHPMMVTIEGKSRGKREAGWVGERRIGRGVWNEQGIKEFRERMGNVETGKGEIGEEWELM